MNDKIWTKKVKNNVLQLSSIFAVDHQPQFLVGYELLLYPLFVTLCSRIFVNMMVFNATVVQLRGLVLQNKVQSTIFYI